MEDGMSGVSGPVLIATKLHPPAVREQTVPREWLMERLRTGSGLRLSLVACPAGFGKTTLLAAWHQAEAARKPVAWLTLDEAYNDPVVLWSYVIEALRRVCPAVGQSVSPRAAGPAHITDMVLPRLVNDLHDQDGATLILDDFHRLGDGAVRESIAWFVDHAPPTFQLVLSTRTEPACPLAALRAHGELLELRVDDLRFTSEEADALLNGRLSLGLSLAEIDDLVERIEGWPAGLYLAALSLRRAADRHALVSSPPQQRQFGQDKRGTLTRYCRDCDVRFACNGGCPKDRFATSPYGESGQHYLCPGDKDFFHHVRQPMQQMAALLRADRAPAGLMQVYTRQDSRRGRSDPCPCQSGRRWKNFIHRLRPVAVAGLVGRFGPKVFASVIQAVEAETVSAQTVNPDPVRVVTSVKAGSIQAIAPEGLAAWASQHDHRLVFRRAVGDFVSRDAPLLAIHDGAPPSPAADARLRGMIALGLERTLEQDAASCIRVMADVAIRALSAAINDPTTAVQGAIQVTRRLRAMLEDLHETVRPEHRAAVAAEIDRLDATVIAGFGSSVDRERAGGRDRQGIGGPAEIGHAQDAAVRNWITAVAPRRNPLPVAAPPSGASVKERHLS